ncbi:CHAP domain-containing protein [Paenibacillus radicis (ex Xue et al. 2023)]|uniref:CHAP domain-containing protein n=1 Tax=Paenibacillus radicis (ex Xue et al. 2023) TaxID=2972489 RepID=A0ABT1YRU3_9BACL|nr:CHAP domain-containing protein [Paenibacillus radicis (ex Xue et al. 2023)]MCR8635023.1 CHAP domain-containing protein [Paenibacillus radicis (ex Xue et al. 2023)]
MRAVVDEKLLKITNGETRRNAYLQLYGVSSYASMLAQKRGLQQHIAAIAGLLHDYYLFMTGIEEFHDQNGAEAIRPILRDMDIFTKEEQRIILCAVFYHSDKANIHNEYDEIVKDAQVLQQYFYNNGTKVSFEHAKRLRKLLNELGILNDFKVEQDKQGIGTPMEVSGDRCERLADWAEQLASKGIIGIPSDKDYRDICLYWTGDNIYKELKASWCAAFVYYCCRKAGLLLPIRFPNSVCRFAGVAAWLEWAQFPDVNFFHSVQDQGFSPARGDIVIYEKLLSNESHDHIGIVLSCHDNELLVAEGNMDNKNQSSLVHRDRWSKILGYIRIDNSYQYKFVGEYKPILV